MLTKKRDKLEVTKQDELKKTNDIKSNIKSDVSEEAKKQELVNITKSKLEVKKENTVQKTVKIQFGAFSKLKNAEQHQKFLNGVFSEEFPELNDKIKIYNENKLYKILHKAKSIKNAEALCEFSKSKKISCLILRK